ncbi:hypothetical protein L6R50_14535 [Myxococcota bacterium]|nr:hypothetical protein [Myxococcota bacterium]
MTCHPPRTPGAVLLLALAAWIPGCERIAADRDVLTPFPSGIEGAPAGGMEGPGPVPTASPGGEGPVVVPVDPASPDLVTEGAGRDAEPGAVGTVDEEGAPAPAPRDDPVEARGAEAAVPPQPLAAAPGIGGDPGPRWASSVPAAAALAAWPLHQVVLVASVPDANPPLAVVRLPDGAEHVVRMGSVIGDTGARVTWIGPGTLTLAEVVMDPGGRPSLGQRVLREP